MPVSVNIRKSARVILGREVEAVLLVLLDECNRFRQRLSMPQVTAADFLAAVKDKLRDAG